MPAPAPPTASTRPERTSAAFRRAATRAASPRPLSSAGSRPRRRSADGLLKVGADPIVVRQRRRRELGDDEASAAAVLELELASGGRRSRPAPRELVPARARDGEEGLSLGPTS